MAKPIIHSVGPNLSRSSGGRRFVITGENLDRGFSVTVRATNTSGTRVLAGHTHGDVEDLDNGWQRVRAIITGHGDLKASAAKPAVPKSDDDLAAITITVKNVDTNEESDETPIGNAIVDV
jgi:hypothetical protein